MIPVLHQYLAPLNTYTDQNSKKMQLKNHIAYRFLTDQSLQMEMAEAMFPNDIQRVLKKESIPAGVRKVAGREQFMTEEAVYGSIKHFLDLTDTPANHKPYYCTETMISLLDRLVVHKKGKHYDWTLFRSLPNQMATFIFPTNDMLRVHIENEMISFLHITYKPIKGEQGNMGWVNFYLNRNTGELCDHFEHEDVINIERFVYTLLCFVYLSDNETIYVPAGTRYGTRKTGKLVNDTPFPMTIINSKWNITSIRTDDIEVGAHFRIFHTGPGRTIPRLQLVNAHVRHGYTRRAKYESLNT